MGRTRANSDWSIDRIRNGWTLGRIRSTRILLAGVVGFGDGGGGCSRILGPLFGPESGILLLILVISDIHHAVDALRRVVERDEQLLILGDLVNLTDYRTGVGAVADVLGTEFAERTAAARATGDYAGMRSLWVEAAGNDLDAFRSAIGAVIQAQYDEVKTALSGARGFAIHGNVDRPAWLEAALPPDMKYVHGEVLSIEGIRFGFVGGGVETPLKADGEMPDAAMTAALEEIGEVDVLCTHVPPAIPELRTDVITGRAERGSGPILDYINRCQPRLHLFGDIHQPKAKNWRLGQTVCRNVGYFRATGTPYELDTSRFA